MQFVSNNNAGLKLTSYRAMSNRAKRDERCGDICEAMIGEYIQKWASPGFSWTTDKWDLALNSTNAGQNAVTRLAIIAAHMEDIITIEHNIFINLPSEEAARRLFDMCIDAIDTIEWWWGSDNDPRRRSMTGARRHQERSRLRAAARSAAGVRGGKSTGKDKGGKSTGKDNGGKRTSNIKGGKADGTPPAGGGAGKGATSSSSGAWNWTATPPAGGGAGKGAASSSSGAWS